MTARIISISFLMIGVIMLIQVVAPLVSFKLWEFGQKYNNLPLWSPKIQSRQVLGVSLRNQDNFPAFISSRKRQNEAGYKEFNLTIPKLGIKQSKVIVDSNDLAQGLVHLPGSALPGEKGNVFVSGHSALSRIFSKDAVFAKLPQLKKGDQILVEAQGTKFTYRVIEIKVVSPTDLSVIDAKDEQGRYLSLMTCVPPGFNTERLIVVGELI